MIVSKYTMSNCICQSEPVIKCCRDGCGTTWSDPNQTLSMADRCPVHSKIFYPMDRPQLCPECIGSGYSIQYISFGFNPKYEVIKKCSILYGVDLR